MIFMRNGKVGGIMGRPLTIGFFIDRVLANVEERFRYDTAMGMYVDDLANDFAQAVCKGVMQGAEEIGANLVIFPGRYFQPVYIDAKRLNYEYQYDHIFSYATEKNMDVLLVLMGCIGDLQEQEPKMKLVQELRKRGLPVITLSAQMDGYHSVRFNNKAGLRQGIEHLINEHGCQRIGFIGGTPGNEDAEQRFEAYKETLLKNGIDYDDNIVRHGNFNGLCEYQVEEVLDEEPKVDAIVFANDQMAVEGYKVFEKRGLVIGKDIKVLGFDNAACARNLNPKLTTVNADATRIGREAILECAAYAGTGKICDRIVDSHLLIRSSCGCERTEIEQDKELLDTENLEKITEAITRDMLLFEGNDDNSIAQLLENLYRIHINTSYIYLLEENKTYLPGEVWEQPRYLYLKARQSGKQVEVIPPEQQQVPFDNLLDNSFYPESRRCTMLIMPLFLKEEQYGVFVCEVDHAYFNCIPSVVYQLSVAVKIIGMLRQQQEIQQQLKDNNVVLDSISKRDELTGIYNRRGFLKEAQAFLQSKENIGKRAIAVYADLDLLKVINDRFGHDEGDFAIRSMAQVLSNLFLSEGVVGRFGGDEFVAVVIPGEEHNWEYYSNMLEILLDELNASSGKPYNVSICMGLAEFTCVEEVSLQEVLAAADSALYKEKIHKVKHVIKRPVD